MLSNACRKWTVAITLASMTNMAYLQFPYPMFPLPAFQPMILPIAVPVTRATTTTSTNSMGPGAGYNGYHNCWPAGLLPCPVMSIPFVISAAPQPIFCKKNPRGSKCPPCPPCICNPCSPAFFSFCSPCHKACRCKTSDDTPTPLPKKPPLVQGAGYPMPLPMQFFMAG